MTTSAARLMNDNNDVDVAINNAITTTTTQ